MKSLRSLLYRRTHAAASDRGRQQEFVMTTRALTRRAALSAVAGLAFAPVAALAQPSVRFRSIQVDVGPLRANSGDPTAAWVEEALPGLLAQAFAPYFAPGDRRRRRPHRADRLSLSRPEQRRNRAAGLVPGYDCRRPDRPRAAGDRSPAETPLQGDQRLLSEGSRPAAAGSSRTTIGSWRWRRISPRWAPRQLGLSATER